MALLQDAVTSQRQLRLDASRAMKMMSNFESSSNTNNLGANTIPDTGLGTLTGLMETTPGGGSVPKPLFS